MKTEYIFLYKTIHYIIVEKILQNICNILEELATLLGKCISL